MWIIAGLGNPGDKYKNTYHNAGFNALDIAARELGVKIKKRECLALTALARAGSNQLLLLKPQTFMNLSGDSVKQALAKYNVPPERLIVIYDDFDLPRSTLRIRAAGGAGTHNGMRSILSSIGTNSFVRVRIGIGKGAAPEADAANFVLSEIPRALRQEMEDAYCRAAYAALKIASGSSLDEVMQEYNGIIKEQD